MEGRIQTRKWQDERGQDRNSTDIVGNQMTMLDGKATDSPTIPPVSNKIEGVDDGFGIPTPYLDEDGDGMPW